MMAYNSGDVGEKRDVFYAKESPYSRNLSFNQHLSEEQVKKAEESYKMQELTIENGTTFDDLDSIKLNNSDPLPPRKFLGIAAEEMCQSGNASCVQPFARIRPLIVAAPNYHMMSCIIQKSMSTVMSAIFCYLSREKEFISAGRNILREMSDIGLCQDENRFKTVDGMLQSLNIDNLSDWRFTMITREPVDRFLSGFIDRCLRVGDDCFGCGSNMTCFLENEYARAQEYAQAEQMKVEKPHLTMEDIHVFPQNWRCNMRKYFNKYEFIRYSNDPSGTLLEDLTNLLRTQNVSESSIDYISESLRSGRTVHSTVKSTSRLFLEKRLRSSPYLMEIIVRLFYHDYRLFGYPLPDLSYLDSHYSGEEKEKDDDTFHLKPLTAEQMKKAEEGYMTPEMENMESIRLNNSDPLPSRKFAGIAAKQMCQYHTTDCVPPFATVRCNIATVPQYRLSTCLVYKSMSTVMSMSICYLLRDEEFVSSGRSILRHSWDLGFCLLNNSFRTVDSMMQKLKIHDISKWRLTMVTREPADRFLSAFIDRCIRVRDPCFGCGNNMTCFLEAEYNRAKNYAYAERLNLSRTKPTEEDKHVYPQSWRCSLQKYSKNYDFIRYSRDPRGTFLNDLNRVLRAQSVPENLISYISTSVQSGRTVHSTSMSSSRAFLERRLLSSPYLMELIVRLFYFDYKVLGYPFPDLDNTSSQS
ncbi:hypothetical protein Aduo_011332 [Ancylostoma duodenale]